MQRTHIQHRTFSHPVPVNYGALDAAKVALAAGGVGLVVGAIALPTFVIGPWIVKAVKPEWSYGRRLAASFAFSTVIGALVRIARAASGSPNVEAAPSVIGSQKTAEVPKAASTTFIPSSVSNTTP